MEDPKLIQLQIVKLKGILEGITIDNKLNDTEIKGLKSWLDSNDHLLKITALKNLFNTIENILEDGVIDKEERDDLMTFCLDLSDEKKGLLTNAILEYVCEEGHKINFRGSFCFSGTSTIYKNKDEMKAIVRQLGGTNEEKVVNNLDYLIICSKTGEWKYKEFGAKIEKVFYDNSKGKSKTRVIREDVFHDQASLQLKK